MGDRLSGGWQAEMVDDSGTLYSENPDPLPIKPKKPGEPQQVALVPLHRQILVMDTFVSRLKSKLESNRWFSWYENLCKIVPRNELDPLIHDTYETEDAYDGFMAFLVETHVGLLGQKNPSSPIVRRYQAQHGDMTVDKLQEKGREKLKPKLAPKGI